VNAARTAETPTGGPSDEGFSADRRVRKGSEIRRLLERGKRKKTRMMDVFFDASPVSHSRLGLIVPKHGRTIVDRNRLRRRLREIGRRELLPRLEQRGDSIDVLLRVHRRAYGASFVELRQDIESTMEALWPERP
jgi:ribonuclease P protein component